MYNHAAFRGFYSSDAAFFNFIPVCNEVKMEFYRKFINEAKVFCKKSDNYIENSNCVGSNRLELGGDDNESRCIKSCKSVISAKQNKGHVKD